MSYLGHRVTLVTCVGRATLSSIYLTALPVSGVSPISLAFKSLSVNSGIGTMAFIMMFLTFCSLKSWLLVCGPILDHISGFT